MSNSNDRMLSLTMEEWVPPAVKNVDDLPCGDMPGDKIAITEAHIAKAEIVFGRLRQLLGEKLRHSPCGRAVAAVCGGSGVGKSEIASLLAHSLNDLGVGCYVLSGDNYPLRIPKHNDAERLGRYRRWGVRALVANGACRGDEFETLRRLQDEERDANPKLALQFPWLAIYQNAGKCGLKSYLGTPEEIDFQELSAILTQFQNGASAIHLKRMGRTESQCWYDLVDFSATRVMIVEWTHGNSDYLQGVDLPVLLNSTPRETLEHRLARNRDGGADSPFTAAVLAIEQQMLLGQAHKAKLIVAKDGSILSYADYMRMMADEMPGGLL